MTHMLPTALGNAGKLTDVLVSCLRAVGATQLENRLSIPVSHSILLVVVDGLGTTNLHNARGHARFLTSPERNSRVIRTVFPSTTAAAMASLMTGEDPIRHGIAGYRIRNPETGVVFNQLNELSEAPSEWMRVPTLARQIAGAADVVVVGRAKFASSPLTATIYDGARYVSAETIENRFHVALEAARVRGRVVVLYVSELDSIAHKHGVSSSKWTDELENLDSCLARYARERDERVTIVVTADHGIVDVDADRHSIFRDRALLEHVSDIGGEPRCLQIFTTDGAPVAAITDRWKDYVGDSATVMERADAIGLGLFGEALFDDDVAARIGDILVLATSETVFYDGHATNTASQRMIGQHGALSEAEMSIPLIVISG